jgi:hypothetical protein
MDGGTGLLQIEDCLDVQGGVAVPPHATLISLIDRNIANVGDATAYRYLDYSRAAQVHTDEVTWRQAGPPRLPCRVPQRRAGCALVGDLDPASPTMLSRCSALSAMKGIR